MMRRKVLGALACAMLMSWGAGFIHADVITDSGGTNAIAVTNISLNGQLYNADFVFGDAANIFGGLPPVFDFNSGADAIAAVDEINLQLDGAPAVGTVGPDGTGFYLVGFEWDVPLVSAIESQYLTNTWTNSGNTILNDGTATSWAVFTQVPEPSSIGLAFLALAFLALAFVRRRK